MKYKFRTYPTFILTKGSHVANTIEYMYYVRRRNHESYVVEKQTYDLWNFLYKLGLPINGSTTN